MSISQFIKANNVKGAIFDMDGTLTDSMGRWSEIYKILFNYLGAEFRQEFLMKLNHIPMKNRVSVIINEFSLNADPKKTYEYWVERASEYYKNAFKIKAYMLNAVKILNEHGVKMGIATASDVSCAQSFIKSNGLDEYISYITGLDEVNRPKSFPDIYLKASQKLGVQPSECIVFEDALTAIKSAKSGGFKVCGVQDDCSFKNENEIRELSDFTLGFTEKIIDKQSTKLIAHRGLSGLFTENTVKAFEEACKRSYYGAECDVHVTSDGKYVIFHDDNTGRLCKDNLIIEQTPFERLRALDFKDGSSKIATLEEYLQIVAKYNKVCVIELKNNMPEKNIAEIINICKQNYSLDKIIYISFHFANLQTVRKLLPNQRVQYLTDKLCDGLIQKLKQNNFGIDIGYWALTSEVIELLRVNSIEINCWMCDDKEKAQILIKMGVDFITTDILE